MLLDNISYGDKTLLTSQRGFAGLSALNKLTITTQGEYLNSYEEGLYYQSFYKTMNMLLSLRHITCLTMDGIYIYILCIQGLS